MKRTGIRQIAEKAGVSVATVSYVLSGVGRVSESTRRRVMEIVAEEGFIRDDAAARLRTGRSNLIGVILNNIVNPFFSELVASLEATAFEAGYMTILATAQNDMVRQDHLLASMVAQGVAGIALSPVHGTTVQDLARVEQHGIPIVVCVRDVPGSHAAFVGVDDQKAGYLAAWALVERGVRRFVFIGGYAQTTTWKGRSAGIAQALAEAGLPDEACQRMPGPIHPDYAEEKILSLAEQGVLPPAVICFNDNQCSGAYRAAGRLGLAVGSDFSVVGFDNIPQGLFLSPELTTVDIHAAQMGRLSADVLLQGKNTSGRQERLCHRLEPQLILRGSIAGT